MNCTVHEEIDKNFTREVTVDFTQELSPFKGSTIIL